MHSLDGIIYINLDHRLDRNQQILSELNRLGVNPQKFHRLCGVYDQYNGIKGCLLSHIQALTLAEEKRWKKVLILEDDVFFVGGAEAIEKQLSKFFHESQEKWDVFFLGGTYHEFNETSWEGFIRIQGSCCAHAYVVAGDYLEKLKACFASAYELIKEHLFKNQSLSYPLDTVWKVLQREDRWYAGKEQFAFQSVGASDIDILYEPLNRFMRIVYIDSGREEPLLEEFERIHMDMKRVFRLKDTGKGGRNNHLAALECAMELEGGNTIIIEDSVSFPKDLKAFDEELASFHKWGACDWDVYLLGGVNPKMKKARHSHFYQLTGVKEMYAYAVYEGYYEILYNHLKNEIDLDFPAQVGRWYKGLLSCNKIS